MMPSVKPYNTITIITHYGKSTGSTYTRIRYADDTAENMLTRSPLGKSWAEAAVLVTL